jgi:hypothetical protein
MRDDKGVFYYPFTQNKRVRMYVKEEEGQIWFRLWSQDDAKLWDDHGWVPWGAVKKAMNMYSGEDFSPQQAYDLDMAKFIIKDAAK